MKSSTDTLIIPTNKVRFVSRILKFHSNSIQFVLHFRKTESSAEISLFLPFLLEVRCSSGQHFISRIEDFKRLRWAASHFKSRTGPLFFPVPLLVPFVPLTIVCFFSWLNIFLHPYSWPSISPRNWHFCFTQTNVPPPSRNIVFKDSLIRCVSRFPLLEALVSPLLETKQPMQHFCTIAIFPPFSPLLSFFEVPAFIYYPCLLDWPPFLNLLPLFRLFRRISSNCSNSALT